MKEYQVKNSEAIRLIQHEDPTLRVFFKLGTIVDYDDISVELAEGLANAEEPGRFFVQHIIPDRRGVPVKNELAPFTFTVREADLEAQA